MFLVLQVQENHYLHQNYRDYYSKNGAFAAILNLDPGVESMPYTCDVDVRDYVDYVSIMQEYELGPNGAMVMANDLIASKIDDIQNDVNKVNPDYLIVDTPGQIELFAYRSSGRFIVDNISSDEKTSVFLFDGSLNYLTSKFCFNCTYLQHQLDYV